MYLPSSELNWTLRDRVNRNFVVCAETQWTLLWDSLIVVDNWKRSRELWSTDKLFLIGWSFKIMWKCI